MERLVMNYRQKLKLCLSEFFSALGEFFYSFLDDFVLNFWGSVFNRELNCMFRRVVIECMYGVLECMLRLC